MRLDLRQLSLSDTRLTLPPSQGHAQYIELGELKALQGTVSQEGASLRLSHVGAELVRVARAALHVGSVGLGVDAPLSLSRPKLELRRQGDALRVDLSGEHAELEALAIDVTGAASPVRFEAKLMLRGVRVHVTEELGRIEAAYAELSSVLLRLGALTLRAPHLVAHELVLGWGGSTGFRLSAATARTLDLEVLAAGARVHALDLQCTGLAVRDGGITVREASVGRLRAERTDAPAPAPHAPPATRAAPRDPRPLADLALLDGLSGHVRCDVDVDLSVSVLPRRARHRVRLEVADGAIDYRDLDRGLAPLEDALLDFGVRGEALVLKLGLPLLRGRGKTLVRWPLGEADRALAESHRVRLSVLAKPERRDTDDEPGDEARDGPLRLHALDASDLDVDLTLARRELAGTALRFAAAERLRVEGELHVRGDGSEDDGRLDIEAKGISAGLDQLALGPQRLDVEELSIKGTVDGRLDLRGLALSDWSVEASDIAVRALALTNA